MKTGGNQGGRRREPRVALFHLVLTNILGASHQKKRGGGNGNAEIQEKKTRRKKSSCANWEVENVEEERQFVTVSSASGRHVYCHSETLLGNWKDAISVNSCSSALATSQVIWQICSHLPSLPSWRLFLLFPVRNLDLFCRLPTKTSAVDLLRPPHGNAFKRAVSQ